MFDAEIAPSPAGGGFRHAQVQRRHRLLVCLSSVAAAVIYLTGQALRDTEAKPAARAVGAPLTPTNWESLIYGQKGRVTLSSREKSSRIHTGRGSRQN
jgi:hypothetical protein